MPRQYRIFYKRGAAHQFSALEPGAHAPIYNRPEVDDAIQTIRKNPSFEGIALRVDDEMFNVIAFEQDALAPQAFEFPAVEGHA